MHLDSNCLCGCICYFRCHKRLLLLTCMSLGAHQALIPISCTVLGILDDRYKLTTYQVLNHQYNNSSTEHGGLTTLDNVGQSNNAKTNLNMQQQPLHDPSCSQQSPPYAGRYRNPNRNSSSSSSSSSTLKQSSQLHPSQQQQAAAAAQQSTLR